MPSSCGPIVGADPGYLAGGHISAPSYLSREGVAASSRAAGGGRCGKAAVVIASIAVRPTPETIAMDPVVARLMERIDGLERRERRWKSAGLGLGLVVAVTASAGAVRVGMADPVRDFRGTVSAKRFEVVDDDGRLMGRFGLDRLESKQMDIFMRHSNATIGFDVSLMNDRPRLMLFPRDGNAKVAIAIDRAGNGSIELLDKSDKPLSLK